MSNEFIGYLNSMNNASSGNENALAEAQIKNKFYDKLKVNRKIGEYIHELLFSTDPKAIILTGHAGDGKTSLLIQVLDKLGYDKSLGLKIQDFVFDKFFYVKDMSELNPKLQNEMLIDALRYPKKGVSSLLISNTGPLINTFKRVIESEEIDKKEHEDNLLEDRLDNIEMKLLDNIKDIVSKDVCVTLNNEEYIFKIINIANIDNTYFASEIISKILNESLWTSCTACLAKNKCPINFNYNILKDSQNRISIFINHLYLWLDENESRLTLRQMISHISFFITGNLTCSEVKLRRIDEIRFMFSYALPNLFFGYEGINIRRNAFNIKAIRDLGRMKLDQIALVEEDYKLFVKQDFSCFNYEVEELITKTLYKNMNNLGLNDSSATELRRSIRRFYIVLSQICDEDYDKLIKQCFSNIYPIYYNLITNEDIRRKDEKEIKNIIFKGLYKTFLGIHTLANETTLYLTLKKDYGDYQNVQLILGEIKIDDIGVKSIKKNGLIETAVKNYLPIIKFQDLEFPLTLQMFDYLDKIKNGLVLTALNPSFSYDLTKWKSDLVNRFKRVGDDELKLLVIRNNSIEQVIMSFEGEKLIVERW